MTLIPPPDWMQPPRLEITSPGRDADGRRVFHLVFHDHGPSVVWRGDSYDAAILAADGASNVMELEAMVDGKFVSYLRVSTARQGASGLGLEAQRKAVADFLAGGRWSLVREFVEVESGKRDDRPKLVEAMALCRLHGAVLVIAKLDRLSRDAHFLLGLQKAGVRFVAADMPEANEMIVGIMAVVVQAERKMISVRTKAALAAAKARGTKLGGDRGNFAGIANRGRVAGVVARQAKATARAVDVAPIIAELQAEGVTSLGRLATALTERGIPTSRGSDRWSPMQVSRVLKASAHVPWLEPAPADAGRHLVDEGRGRGVAFAAADPNYADSVATRRGPRRPFEDREDVAQPAARLHSRPARAVPLPEPPSPRS